MSWLATADHVVKYEDLVRHVKAIETREAETFYRELLAACGIDLPSDWRQRVKIGSDRKHSGTARENLTGAALEIPDELPDIHRRLIDYVVPGLREILGYA